MGAGTTRWTEQRNVPHVMQKRGEAKQLRALPVPNGIFRERRALSHAKHYILCYFSADCTGYGFSKTWQKIVKTTKNKKYLPLNWVFCYVHNLEYLIIYFVMWCAVFCADTEKTTPHKCMMYFCFCMRNFELQILENNVNTWLSQ